MMAMKYFASILTLFLVWTASCVSAADETSADPSKYTFDSTEEAMQFGLGRGAANLFCCVVEIPRNLSYEFTARPFAAPVTGPLMGATLTAARAFFGVVDVLTAGYTGNYPYAAAIPDYPWESPWVSQNTELE
jgi:putative exosortase-associated protein (TIGR04073 family)